MNAPAQETNTCKACAAGKYSNKTGRRTEADCTACPRGTSMPNGTVAATSVAACQACHDANARPTYPRLAGQSATYLQAQLQLWRDAPPTETAYGDLMAHAVGKITDDQIRDVSAWYASQPPFGPTPGEASE